MYKRKGLTLLEVLVTLVLLSIAVAICLPLMANKSGCSRRTNCASNLSQIGKGMILYADQGGNGDIYPTVSTSENPMDPKADAQVALGLLYKSYINDVRVFSCQLRPMSQRNIDRIAPSTAPSWTKSTFSQEPPGAPASWEQSSSYGYSPGHRQEDGPCVVLADHQGASPNGNSDNHGIGVGQNCLIASGAVNFMGTIVNRGLGKDEESGEPVVDLDIYKEGGVIPLKRKDLDSFCR